MKMLTVVPGARRGRARGFTLIELLVVIAIIAILAAILFPVFAQAREKARAISCLSNLKQVGIAVVQYNQDYDEKEPNGDSPYGSGSGWANQIFPYIKSVNAFRCPDDAGVGPRASSYGYNGNFVISFGANNYVPYPEGGAPSHSLADFNGPAKTVMLFEVTNSKYYDMTNNTGTQGSNGLNADNQYNGGSPSGNGIGADNDPNGNNAEAAGTNQGDGYMKYATGYLRYSNPTNGGPIGQFTGKDGRHQMGANYLMADTHAKFLRPNSVTGGQSYAPDNQYYLCGSPYTNGANAATVECSDNTIAATFNIQ